MTPKAAWQASRFTIGFDQIYGKGYYESLERGKRAEFWTLPGGIFAHGMSQDLQFRKFACLRVSNGAMRQEYAQPMGLGFSRLAQLRG
jgi:hypothetical protein